MFIEPRQHQRHSQDRIGWIEVICGSMFSGKTEELIRRINRAIIAQQEVRIFKPALDVRYDSSRVVSHNKNALSSFPITHSSEILEKLGNCKVVAIDEAQFFDSELTNVCVKLANDGCRVIVSGLDMDYLGKPFGEMPNLMAVAEYVTKLHAICVQCGEVAMYSYRLALSEKQVLLGEKKEYEARCRKCFYKGIQEKLESQKTLFQSNK
ncbi:MAG: thymidine kinase [Flammeovirgaceae bacterium]